MIKFSMRKTFSILALIVQTLTHPLQLGVIFWQSLCISAYTEVLNTVETAMKRIFTQANQFVTEQKSLSPEQILSIEQEANVTIDPAHDLPYYFILAQKDGHTIGYGIDHIVSGKWGPIRYLLSLDLNGSIIDITILEFSERRGKPISKRRFIRQFLGKTLSNPIKLRKDIRSVSGASISSRGITDGIRKSLHVFHTFYK